MQFSRLGTVALVAGLAIGPIVVTSPPAHAALQDCAFGFDQVFDVQWNISGGNLNISSVTRPFYSTPLEGYSSAGQYPADYLQTGDYFRFEQSGSDVGFVLYDSNGDLKHQTHNTGTFRAIGDDFLFYLGNGSWGTVITTSNAYPYGSSASLPITEENPSIDTALAYTSCSASPLSYSLPSGDSEEEESPSEESEGEGEAESGGSESSGGGNDEDESDSSAVATVLEPAIGLEFTGQPGARADGVTVFASGTGLSVGSPLTLTVSQAGISVSETIESDGSRSYQFQIPGGLAAGEYSVTLTGQGPNGEVLTLTNRFTIDEAGTIVSVTGNTGSVVGAAQTTPAVEEERLAYTGGGATGIGVTSTALAVIGIFLIVYSIRARRMFAGEDLEEVALTPWEILQRPIVVPGVRYRAAESGGTWGSSHSNIHALDYQVSRYLAVRLNQLERRLDVFKSSQ